MNSSEMSIKSKELGPNWVDPFDHRVKADDLMKWQKKKILEILSKYGSGPFDMPEEEREASKAEFTKLLQAFNEANPDVKDPYKDLPPRMKAGERRKLLKAQQS